METWEINGYTLEYIEESHTYLVDGIIVPSITQAMKVKFGKKYEGIDNATLQNAANKGTEMHEAIQRYCENGEESEMKEVRNFKFLQKQYKFEVLKNEQPVILFDGNEPILAGRLDMVIEMKDQIGLADLKRTSTLDKEYLAYQLNLYRIAYQQSYGENIEILRGIHLREDTRKFVTIPINEEKAWELVREFQKGEE
jgi:hypothetical protein